MREKEGLESKVEIFDFFLIDLLQLKELRWMDGRLNYCVHYKESAWR